LDFGSTSPDKVIKVAGDGENAPARVLGEQKALRVLRQIGLPVPEVEFTQEDVPSAPRPFFTMPHLQGESLEATYRASFPWEEKAWRHAGRFVAEMRRVSLEDVREVVQPAWNDFDGVRSSFEKHGLLRAPFISIIDEAQSFVGHDDGCFIHGDYASTAVIANAESFVVVDWENTTTGSLLDALGRINAMTREYGPPEKREQHIRWTTEGFEELEPLDEKKRHELHVREMMNHLGVMSWKLGWYPDHDAHARAMVGRVEEWTYL